MPSENGWNPAWAGENLLEWIKVPGTNVSLRMLKGPSLSIMRAFAADYNAYVEPLRDPDSACYTPTNSVSTSNHLNATGMDLNWNSHPFHVKGTFTAAQMKTIRDLQSFYTIDGLQLIFWAGDWKSPIDEMHWQMQYQTYGDARLGKFIAKCIRADGFSTYRRGNASVPATLSKREQYAVAIIQEGKRRAITPRGIQIALSVALVETNLTMYANSSVPESLRIPHDKVGSDHDSVGLFQQRCPMWGPAEVLMNPALSAGLFYDRLVKLDYNRSRPPGDYAADVQRPAAQYRGRYQERMGDAVALYNSLESLPANELSDWDALMASDEPVSSLSPYRDDDNKNFTPLLLLRNLDSMVHASMVETAALEGQPWAVDLVARLAQGQGPAGTDAWAVEKARNIISIIQTRLNNQAGIK